VSLKFRHSRIYLTLSYNTTKKASMSIYLCNKKALEKKEKILKSFLLLSVCHTSYHYGFLCMESIFCFIKDN